MKCNQEIHRSLFLQHATCLPRLGATAIKFHGLMLRDDCSHPIECNTSWSPSPPGRKGKPPRGALRREPVDGDRAGGFVADRRIIDRTGAGTAKPSAQSLTRPAHHRLAPPAHPQTFGCPPCNRYRRQPNQSPATWPASKHSR